MKKATATKAHKSCFASAAELIGANEGLADAILRRLPPKSVIRFKCVSKQWLSLICPIEKLISPAPTALLLYQRDSSTREFNLVSLKDCNAESEKVPIFDFLMVPPIHNINIWLSCNGLFVCSSIEESTYWFNNTYFICNPSTKQFKILNFPFKEEIGTTCFSIFLLFLGVAFDPKKSPHYKVVCIYGLDIGDQFGPNFIVVYKSETDSWSPSRTPIKFPEFQHDYTTGILWNGAFHWCSDAESSSFYFNMDSETLKEMPMPSMFSSRNSNWTVMYFGESRGHLQMIPTNTRSSLEFQVFEMALDYSGWSVMYDVNLNSMTNDFPDLVWGFRIAMKGFSVLSIIGTENEEESVVIYVDGKVMSYNLSNGKSTKLCDVLPRAGGVRTTLTKLDYEWHDAYQYFDRTSSFSIL